ncbi:DUF3105 domain-containing protein [Blastococcus sp. TF02A-35]|uniref:DUF3105 domain-containing protein n=1 Tax=Blastococcus sp. TF02A-35 TaxID=2559612 RepID=UPI0010745C2D|nr:DUF3105 domain-containing protein [Blastococcus sp. TF02A_35]TFV52397.1 DUF3105 domain-containing protein [Blastococcus sp. TF02A_35]
MAKDRTPDKSRATGGGSSRSGAGAGGRGKGGRTRPPTQVVSPQRPWGLIAFSVALAVFAVTVLGYALAQVRKSEADKVESIDEISGAEVYEYEGGQHDDGPLEYEQSPPVGGMHANQWADCTGTVYDVDIRHENAVHSLEHGAVWITYNPDEVSDADVDKLAELVDGVSGRMLSPYEGQDTQISVQSWGHQLKVDSADDKRIKQFAELMTYKSDSFPEPGATCERPDFLADPPLESDDAGATPAPAQTPAPAAETPAP